MALSQPVFKDIFQQNYSIKLVRTAGFAKLKLSFSIVAAQNLFIFFSFSAQTLCHVPLTWFWEVKHNQRRRTFINLVFSWLVSNANAWFLMLNWEKGEEDSPTYVSCLFEISYLQDIFNEFVDMIVVLNTCA